MKMFDDLYWVLYLFLFIFLGLLIYLAIEHKEDTENKCKDAGGILVRTKYEMVCFSKEVIIKIK